MKKLLSGLLAVLIVCSVCILPIYAEHEEETNGTIISRTIEYADDGSYMEILIFEDNNGIMPLASTYTKSGTKVYNSRNADGEILWTFSLKGTFTVNPGVSATCTSSVYTTSNLASGWELEFGNASKSGNKAMADYIFKHKVLFITTQTVEGSLTLTCSANGTLS